MALAGPANRQGRIAAEVIAGRASRFRGVQGTSIVGLFGAAGRLDGRQREGAAARRHRRLRQGLSLSQRPCRLLSGAKTLSLKLLYRKSDGRVLGGQAFSLDAGGADKRISALAVAIQMEATIDDLAEAELCYAPYLAAPRTRWTSPA